MGSLCTGNKATTRLDVSQCNRLAIRLSGSQCHTLAMLTVKVIGLSGKLVCLFD